MIFNGDAVNIFTSLCLESLSDFDACITTNCLARSASINDSLLDEAMDIVEDSSTLMGEFKIFDCQLSWQLEQISWYLVSDLLQVDDLLSLHLDLCLRRRFCSLQLRLVFCSLSLE